MYHYVSYIWNIVAAFLMNFNHTDKHAFIPLHTGNIVYLTVHEVHDCGSQA